MDSTILCFHHPNDVTNASTVHGVMSERTRHPDYNYMLWMVAAA
jgi:hypothetical protein